MNITENKAFSEALVELVSVSAELPPTPDHPAFRGAVAKVCGILRAAKCESVLYEQNGPALTKNELVLFAAPDAEYDRQRREVFRKVTGEGNRTEFILYQAEGAPDWTDDERNNAYSFLSSLFLILGRARVMQIAEKLAFHDTEMDVFNLKYLMRILGMLIAKKEIAEYACCRYNFRNFSAVNSRIGRENGTKVMHRYVYGLRDLIGEDGFTCRLGGDNFVILFKQKHLEEVKEYLSGRSVQTDFRGLPEIFVSAYGGCSILTGDCRAPDDIMRKVTIAGAAARKNPKEQFCFYNEQLNQMVENRRMIESIFFDCLDSEEFLVYYQPKVNLKNHTLCGAEALCRWRHDGKLVPPMQFIPVLEQSNYICDLDFYMLKRVCRDIRRWIDENRNIVKVSVNMSRVHLGNNDLHKQIMDIIDYYAVPHDYIEIELTETTTDVDFKELKTIVSSLRKEGVSVSVDDFGVGYSSLNLIRDLPWNVLKIDKSFLPDDLDENKNSKQVMLKYVISMAHDLGLECIVEGVETDKHVALLKELNCYRAQGFHFDRPLPLEDFEKRLDEPQYEE